MHFYEVHQAAFKASSILLKGFIYLQILHYRHLSLSSFLLLKPLIISLVRQVNSCNFFDEEPLTNLSVNSIHLLMNYSWKQVYLRHHHFLYHSSFLISLAYNQTKNGDFDHFDTIYLKIQSFSCWLYWLLRVFLRNQFISMDLI